MPSIARSNSHNHNSPSTNFSIPLQSPNFSLSDLQLGSQPFDRSPRAHGRPQSLEFASSLGTFRISNHSQPHDAQSATTGVNHFDAVNEDIPHSAANQYNLLSPRLWTQQSVWPCPTLQEACLMRYFVEKLAHWVSLHFSLIRADATTIHAQSPSSLAYPSIRQKVLCRNPCTDSTKFDLCDPERHFALVVPQRARSCPPLLNAIFTASARHLSRLDKYKTAEGVKYLGKLLPDLNVETAIHYHDRAIAHLIQLCNNPNQVHDENLLAAATILRFYEEVDGMLFQRTPTCVGTNTEYNLKPLSVKPTTLTTSFTSAS